MELKCVLLYEGAKIPKKSSPQDAGFDLYYAPEPPGEFCRVRGGERQVIPTGVSIAIPEGYYGRIAPRSGLAVNNGIDILAGTIDAGYRGQIKVVLYNTGFPDPKYTCVISPGDRIAQLIIEKIHPCNSFTVVDKLDETQRGEGGFGSTGK